MKWPAKTPDRDAWWSNSLSMLTVMLLAHQGLWWIAISLTALSVVVWSLMLMRDYSDEVLKRILEQK